MGEGDAAWGIRPSHDLPSSASPLSCTQRLSLLVSPAAVGEGDAAWNTLERVSYVWLKDRWVAYPFQVGAGTRWGQLLGGQVG